MSNFFKSKYKLIALMTALLLVVTGLTVFYAQSYLKKDLFPPAQSEEPPEEESEPDDPPFVEEVEEVPITNFRVPDVMRGAFINAGVEYLTSGDNSVDDIKAQIDSAIVSAKDYSLNSIIINPSYNDTVTYITKDSPRFSEFDAMEYISSAARDEGMFVYGVFDISDYKSGGSGITMAIGSGQYDQLYSNIGEFAEKYDLDGILLDGYQNEASEDSYSLYRKIGGAIGFTNYMRQTPEVQLRTAAGAIRAKSPDTQVGLLADSVWANADQQEGGSNTTATYTSLGNANADTKAFIENGLVDFVLVKATGSTKDTEAPFGKVVEWWAELAQKRNIPLYVMQASSKVGSGGWGLEELVNQAVALDEISGVRGNAFDSLKQLSAKGIGEGLKKYYVEEVEPELILAKLEMTKPTETTYTTNETQVTFTGASDPTEPLTINGTNIPTDQSGYFTVTYELKGGGNQFEIIHKDRTLNYQITRQINVLTEIAPTGNITADGGMEITISAIAYDGATVTANVGGSSVSMVLDESVVDESSRDSTYKKYTGVFTAPGATTSEQNLGAISVTASWQGESKTLTGGSVRVNKKAKIEDGVPVVVVADQAKTYPANTLDNIPRADSYPLPKGAMDYAVGEEIEYKDVGYTVLASGLRVKSEDIATSSDYVSGNAISALSVDVANGFTYVTLKTGQKVSYNFKYTSGGVSVSFNNTDSVPENMTLSQNPIFSSAQWSGATLNLDFVKSGGFMGFKSYYDGSDLVLRFNNTPSSIAGARIAIDPGHGGKDVGALGFLTDYPEKVLNWSIAAYLADELQARGATVLLLDTSGGMDLASRVAKAEDFEADLFISVHNNTAPNAEAKGTEVYYFYPFSKALASGASSAVSSQLGTTNRGARQSYYTVTLSPQFASVLVECGFMSNRSEYEKLIRTKYHERIAVGIADGISSAISSAYTGVGGGGSEGSGGTIDVEGTPDDPGSTGETVKTGITLNRSTMSLIEGTSATIKATVTPSDANQTVTWESDDTDVADVDSGGRVTGVTKGTAKIIATSKAGDKAVCTVTVAATGGSGGAAVNDVILSHNTASIKLGGTFQLDVEVYPDDASNKDVEWSSSNTDVATVDSDGFIKGVTKGNATITVTSVDGRISASCIITVADESGADSGALKDAMEIEIFDHHSTMYRNGTQTLKVRTDKDLVVPNSQLSWESSNRKIATVDSNGVISARRVDGTVTISVTDKADELYDYIKITVTGERVKMTEIKLNNDVVQLEKGTTNDSLKATITPRDANQSELVWTITNTKIASISDKGVITGIRIGSTTLKVKDRNSKTMTTCRIQVVDSGKIEIYDIGLDINNLEMYVGDEDYLVAEIDPSSAKPTIIWKSSNAKVVSVDSKGNIKAIAKGKAKITATVSGYDDLSDSCDIEVIE